MSQAIIISLSLGTGKSGITDLRAQLVDSAGGDVGVAISQGFADMAQGNYQWYCASIPDDFTFGGVKFFSDATPTVTLASTAISGVDFLPVTGGKIDVLSTVLSATSRIPDSSVPRNATQGIPVVIALHNPDGSALPGQASTLSATVTCLDNGLVLDAADNRFRDSPTSPSIPLAPIAVTPHIYLATLSPAGWPRGNYQVRTIRSGTNDEFVSAFSLGLNVKRSLGYSAVYNGTALTLSVWVEEDGVPQTDYTAIQNAQLLNAAGNLVTGGDLGNNTSPNNGIFTFTKTLTCRLVPITCSDARPRCPDQTPSTITSLCCRADSPVRNGTGGREGARGSVEPDERNQPLLAVAKVAFIRRPIRENIEREAE